MNFPTLFFGDPRDVDIVEIFRYRKIAQWELMHHSGDFSYHTTNLFFKTLRIIIEKFLACISIRIKKWKLKGRKLLTKDVKYKPNLDNILKSDIRYINFKHIRISPYYLQQMKKNIFSMIRQQGPPTFFITFTSVEHQWTPFLNTLTKLHSKRKKRKHIETIEDYNIDYLIRNNPVTCTRYYRHRISPLKKRYLKKKHSSKR